YAPGVPPELHAQFFAAGHPLPDERGVRATGELLTYVSKLHSDDRLILLLSGGASALLGAPIEGVPIDAWRAAQEALLGARGAIAETPKPGHPRFRRVRHRILATPLLLRDRAAERARAAGFEPIVEPALVEGAVEELAERLAARAPGLPPGGVLIAVGEPTVRLHGRGTGGRAQHLAGLMALRIAGTDAAFVALGSDGTDGPT